MPLHAFCVSHYSKYAGMTVCLGYILKDTMFAISSLPNPKWSDAPNGKARKVMNPATKWPNRDIDGEYRHPGQLTLDHAGLHCPQSAILILSKVKRSNMSSLVLR